MKDNKGNVLWTSWESSQSSLSIGRPAIPGKEEERIKEVMDKAAEYTKEWIDNYIKKSQN